jgi:type II secretory pathway predicted ATPase ExeA
MNDVLDEVETDVAQLSIEEESESKSTKVIVARSPGMARTGLGPAKPPSTGVRQAQMDASMARQSAIAQLTADPIKHPMHNMCMATIASLHAWRRIGGKTARGMLVTGLTGSGKSTIAKAYASDYPRFDEDERSVIPVLYVELPSQPTSKVIAERFLNAMGDPYAERGGAEQKLHRIRHLLAACSVELVIVDEFQHVTDNLDARNRDIAADTLKNLMNDSCVPFVFLGGPSCRGYFVKNQQLNRRCTPKIQLRPFGLSSQEDGELFQSMLKSLEERLPFEKESALMDVDLVEPLWFASFGLIGHLTQLVAAALDIALDANAPTLSRQHLGRAFAETIYVGCPVTRNPFHQKFNNRPLTEKLEPFHGFDN